MVYTWDVGSILEMLIQVKFDGLYCLWRKLTQYPVTRPRFSAVLVWLCICIWFWMYSFPDQIASFYCPRVQGGSLMRKWGKRICILALAVVMNNNWCWEESLTGETIMTDNSTNVKSNNGRMWWMRVMVASDESNIPNMDVSQLFMRKVIKVRLRCLIGWWCWLC